MLIQDIKIKKSNIIWKLHVIIFFLINYILVNKLEFVHLSRKLLINFSQNIPTILVTYVLYVYL